MKKICKKREREKRNFLLSYFFKHNLFINLRLFIFLLEFNESEYLVLKQEQFFIVDFW
jgi:hypothetical protein